VASAGCLPDQLDPSRLLATTAAKVVNHADRSVLDVRPAVSEVLPRRRCWLSRTACIHHRSGPHCQGPQGRACACARAAACWSRRGRPVATPGHRAGGRHRGHPPCTSRTRRFYRAECKSALQARAWSRFFQTALDRARTDQVEHLELDESLRKKRDGPPCPPLRRLTASNLHQPGLRCPIEFSWTRGVVLGLALQARFETTLAHAFHRHEPSLQIVGDLLVGQPLVGFQQDACAQPL